MRQNYADPEATARFAGKFDAAANTNAVITVAASPNEFWVIDAIGWSYSAAPTNGRLVASIGGVTLIDIDIIAGGPGLIELRKPFYKTDETRNEALVITLHAGSGSVVGKVYCRYR
jgi:hypothetical protein